MFTVFAAMRGVLVVTGQRLSNTAAEGDYAERRPVRLKFGVKAAETMYMAHVLSVNAACPNATGRRIRTVGERSFSRRLSVSE